MSKECPQKFEHQNVLRMFPSFVWRAEIAPETHRPLNDAIVRALGEIGAPLAGLEPGESWQSAHGLHARAELRSLVDIIDAAAASALDYLEVEGPGIQITGCWANVSGPGARHATHTHPNNYLSGVYYVRTWDGADTINFHDPRPQIAIIRPPVRQLTAENTDQVVVKVKDGTLLLFPAWLGHSVDPNRSRNTRITISFNLMFPAYAETLAHPLWEGGPRRSG